MSFIGSLASINSRVSELSVKSTVIRGAYCTTDPKTDTGRRMLYAQLLLIPTIPIFLLTLVSVARLGQVSAIFHRVDGLYSAYGEQEKLISGIFAVQNERLVTALCLSRAILGNGSVLGATENPDEAFHQTDVALMEVEEESWSAKGKGNNAPSSALDADLWNENRHCENHCTVIRARELAMRPYKNESYDSIISCYSCVVQKMVSSIPIETASAEVNHHTYALRSLLSASENFHFHCLLGLLYFSQGYLRRHEYNAYLGSLKLADGYILDWIEYDPLLQRIYNDTYGNISSLHLDLDAYRDMTLAESLGGGNISLLNGWYNICDVYSSDVIDNMYKATRHAFRRKGLDPAWYDSMQLVIIYLVIILIQIPIFLFLINNAKVTTRNICGIVQIFASRITELKKERRKTELLLSEMLPKSVAKALRSGKMVSADQYDSVTLLFSDIPNFGDISNDSEPMQIVTMLNNVYNFLDGKIECYDVYKVETIGSTYMVASGLPIVNGDKHLTEICDMALEIIQATEDFVIPHMPNTALQLRIGAHTGPCCAGVVGNKQPRYCVFGDTVNTTSRMQSNGLPQKIHISEPMRDALHKLGDYTMEHRGSIEIKGKGAMNTYWLVSRKQRMRLRTSNHVRMDVKRDGLLSC